MLWFDSIIRDREIIYVQSYNYSILIYFIEFSYNIMSLKLIEGSQFLPNI